MTTVLAWLTAVGEKAYSPLGQLLQCKSQDLEGFPMHSIQAWHSHSRSIVDALQALVDCAVGLTYPESVMSAPLCGDAGSDAKHGHVID